MVATSKALGNDIRTLGLICPGHFLSHFYQLSLPPLFHLIRADIEVSFIALGTAVGAYNIATAFLQTPVGFLVDRIGARWVLIAGLFLNGVAFVAMGMADSYLQIVAALVLAGIGNSVFHPADFAILSASIEESRMGRAFSAHSLSGSLGFAAAPVTVLFLASVWDWRIALIAVGLAGIALAAVMLPVSGMLRADGAGKSERSSLDIRILLNPTILAFFGFFVLSAAAGSGLSVFSIVAFIDMYGVSQELAGGVLTLFFVLIGLGVAVGGFIADRWGRHDLVLGISYTIVAILLAGIATGAFAFWLVVVAFGIAGIFRGVVNPSRDILLRRLAPAGSTGAVFGFVTTGFNVGLGAAPILYGWMMDQGSASGVFWIATVFTVLTIGIVFLARKP